MAKRDRHETVLAWSFDRGGEAAVRGCHFEGRNWLVSWDEESGKKTGERFGR
jgi:hypothetical protein